MKKQKTKLGARILSEEELKAVLPNAESVYEQIEAFRNSMPGRNCIRNGEQYEIEQKTNNIGIMGRRGTGKTSILKTFYHKLKSENENGREKGRCKKRGDIILPIVIPENMSAGTTLMDAVLGRLKSVVEEREMGKEKDQYRGDCIYSGQDCLEKQYNELVKQYCYIKKDYRDILIQEFTTEQNYVDKTKKVFGSDSEFIRLFHQFLDSLLERGKESAEKSPLLFLFIDDVDLSVNRCMDIVRTLLVYLSHPGIITFISGDMKTFEEELTLEFLRQEGALREGVFQETYHAVSDDAEKSSLLEQKKVLAYEYLKKIIPPAYRRTIRYWALEDRGNYRIVGDGGDVFETLSELLIEVAKEKLDHSYFVYKEGGEQKCMRLAFHMFDDTARGLNNVYNVLQEIYEIQTNEKEMTEERKTLLFWRLIETMVDSKVLYANYKSELLTKVIALGQEQEQVKVKIDFENAYRLLYGEKEESKEGKDKDKEDVKRFSAKDRFAIFYLIDFAARLFLQERFEEENEGYDRLKRRVIQEYLSDETIEDRIAPKKKLLEYLVDGTTPKKWRYGSQDILFDFLTKCNFTLALHFIRYIGREEIYDIWGENSEETNAASKKNSKSYDEKIAVYKIAYAFSRSIWAVSETEERLQNNLVYLYGKMKMSMLSLLSKLSLNMRIIFGGQLIVRENVGVSGMRYINDNDDESDLAEISLCNIENYIARSKADVAKQIKQSNFLWAEYENQNSRYWIYYENSLREQQDEPVQFNIKDKAKELISAGLTKSVMNLLETKKAINWLETQHGMSLCEIKALGEVSYNGLSDGKDDKEKRDIAVIQQIDKQELWGNAYVKNIVCKFLENKKDEYINKISSGRMIFDATQFVQSYNELKNCDKGPSGKALVCDLESKIRCVLFLSVPEEQQNQEAFADGKYYLRLEQALIIWCLLEEFLKVHWKARYGKKEIRRLLMEVKELPLLLHTERWYDIDRKLGKREDEFFKKNLVWLEDESAEVSGKKEEYRYKIETIRKIWYDNKDRKSGSLKYLIRKYLGEDGEKYYRYFRYWIQRRQTEKMEKEWEEELGKKLDWSAIEPSIPEKDCLFIFHSYLRYLQVNDSDAKNAGVQAEEIVKLAEYMLDSEIKADEKIQTDFYQMISEDLALTEEEFEKLF